MFNPDAVIRKALLAVAMTMLPLVAVHAQKPAALHFRDIGPEAGLTTVPHSAAVKQYLVEMMGGGVGLFDCDNDGKLDIVTVTDSTVDAYLHGGELMVTLYHQDTRPGGPIHFTDITRASGLTTRGWGMGVAIGDFDNDGLPDIYVTGYGHNVLYRNLGGCKFEDVTAQKKVSGGGFSVGAAWADYDRDGKLDLFVSRYVDTDLHHLPKPGDKAFQYQGLPMDVPVLNGETLSAERGKLLFDDVRRALSALQADLDRATVEARTDLSAAATRLQIVLALIAVGLIVLLAVLALGLRRVVVGPVDALTTEVRRVSEGDFGRAVRIAGPREFVSLGENVDTMRRHIVDELDALREATDRLDQQAKDLERSNAELEQFAYVASHDLQEPLRKVASFSQLLERRYKGQLDERADQYIAFAVDGAKRMQVLINDLLAFSRVGRLTREHAEVDGNEIVGQALANLSLAVEETGAEVTVEDLPRISGDVSLLTGVVQNLISNAIKFRGDEPPKIHIGVRDAGDEWEFSVADNGIGISAEYAERIFVIFQRLHPKDAYPGTGIGLAMARKIIEYHGGRIWLDTDVASGTTFRFTRPKPAADDVAADGAVAQEPETVS